jgi:hypothetical protein
MDAKKIELPLLIYMSRTITSIIISRIWKHHGNHHEKHHNKQIWKHNKQDIKAWKHGSIRLICTQQTAIYVEANKFEMYNITMVPANCTKHVPTSSSSVHNY